MPWFCWNLREGYKRDYLDFLWSLHGDLQTSWRWLEGKAKLRIEAIIDLSLAPPERPTEKPISIWDYLDPNSKEARKVVIIGLPGSGKTTLLLQMTSLLSRHDRKLPASKSARQASYTARITRLRAGYC